MRVIGIIFAMLSAVIWGLVYALDEKILTKFSAIQMLLTEALLFIIIALPLMIITHQFSALKEVLVEGESRTQFLLLLVTIVISGLANLFILSSISRIGASTAAIFEIAYPFFVVVFGYFLYGKQISWQFAVGSACVFVGSVIIVKWA
jgi:drug/metabolite transporter (DMT)-like permease